MSKKVYKLTLGIKAQSSVPPTFMEGEAPGVFAIKEFEVTDEGQGDAAMAHWALNKEDEIIAECVETKWEEIE